MIRLLGFINRVGEVFPIRAPGVCQLADTFHSDARVRREAALTLHLCKSNLPLFSGLNSIDAHEIIHIAVKAQIPG